VSLFNEVGFSKLKDDDEWKTSPQMSEDRRLLITRLSETRASRQRGITVERRSFRRRTSLSCARPVADG